VERVNDTQIKVVTKGSKMYQENPQEMHVSFNLIIAHMSIYGNNH